MGNNKTANKAKAAEKKKKDEAKAAEKKKKDEAKAEIERKAAHDKKMAEKATAAELKEANATAAKKLPTAKGYYVAKGKAVVCNAKGYLVNGAPVKPEWFTDKKAFDKFVETGHIIKI